MKFLILLLLLASLSLISAHFSVSPTQIPNVGTTLLTFNAGHACDTNSFTYKVVFMFPPNITSVKPIYKAGWTVNYTSIALGYKTSAGVDAFRLVYTFNALPGSEFPTWTVDTMLFRVTAPTGSGAWSVGSTFAIPVYQYCTGDLLDAWNTTTTGDSHSSSESGALPAPMITILDSNDIQQIPSQNNVRALATQIAALSTSGSGMSSSSSSWLRADTISVIAIILGGIGIFCSLVLASRLQRVEKQNHILREKLQTQQSSQQELTKTMEDTNKHTVSFHAQE